MFIVIYRFSVKAKKHDQFKKAWKEMTKLILNYSGSYGSRLHKENDSTFIAYAQWPDEISWKMGFDKLPKQADIFSKQMQNSCDKIETIHKMTVVEDLLKSKNSG